jgi:hypothetical protein
VHLELAPRMCRTGGKHDVAACREPFEAGIAIDLENAAEGTEVRGVTLPRLCDDRVERVLEQRRFRPVSFALRARASRILVSVVRQSGSAREFCRAHGVAPSRRVVRCCS